MTDKTKKSKGPTCACGKEDLYEEWLKSNEKSNEEDSDSTTSKQSGDDDSPADDSGKDAKTE